MFHANLLLLIGFFATYAQQNSLPFRITSLKGPAENRIYSCHKDGRCADLSLRRWSKHHIANICKIMNDKYKSVAAISYKQRKPVACLMHKVKGNAYHFHLQVKP